MKKFVLKIASVMCAALCFLPLAAGTTVAHAGDFGLGVKAILSLGSNADDDYRRRHRDDDNHGRDDRKDDRKDDRRDDRGEDRRDNRINVAMSIASSRGHVLDAGQENGSVFWVRVATDHGRVDYLVDTDQGRIIGER